MYVKPIVLSTAKCSHIHRIFGVKVTNRSIPLPFHYSLPSLRLCVLSEAGVRSFPSDQQPHILVRSAAGASSAGFKSNRTLSPGRYGANSSDLPETSTAPADNAPHPPFVLRFHRKPDEVQPCPLDRIDSVVHIFPGDVNNRPLRPVLEAAVGD